MSGTASNYIAHPIKRAFVGQGMGFSGQEYWNGLPFPSPGDLPDPGIEPGSPALPVDSLSSKPPGKSPKLYWLTRKLLLGGHER